METLTKEQLTEINNEIQKVLTKYGVMLQPTIGISYVLAPKPTEIVSPLQKNDLNNPTA
jgi:hypothetical protein